jgi:hypothetical protein
LTGTKSELLNGTEQAGVEYLSKRKRIRDDNIKAYLREIGLEGVDWILLAQDRDQWRALVNTVMNLQVP